MAEAMLSRALAEHIVAAGDVCVAEPIAERRDQLAKRYSIAVTASNTEAAQEAGLVVLAVKPQQFPGAAEELCGALRAPQAVLSIIAGLPVTAITKALKHQAVIRVMPNTPAQIGAGMSVWTATADVHGEARDAAQALLRVLG